MTKQTINLLGGLVVVAILFIGVFLGVLPRLHDAQQSHQQRDTVARQNQTQQMLISAYGAQRKQLPAVQAELASLQQQIADGPHLEQLIDVASNLPGGAVLVSITPGDASSATGAAPAAAPSASATPGATPGAAPAGSGSGAFQALPVSLVVTLAKAADAPAVLDKLRAGPRLFAIDHVTLAGAGAPSAGSGAKAGGTTLTVDGRVFMKQAAQ